MENIEEIQFKAPIPRQGILLIGDFRDNSKYYLKGFQPVTQIYHHLANIRDY